MLGSCICIPWFMTRYLVYITSSYFIILCLCITIQLLVLLLYLYPAMIFLFLYFIPCVADPSRSLNPKLFICFHLPYLNTALSVIYFLLTHVYHMTPYMLSLDPLTCHHLVRPSGYVMIDPVNYLFIVMFYCLLYITTLSCYPLNQAWYTWLHDYLVYGNPALFYGTKCHTILGGGHLLNLLGYFLLCPVIPVIW